MEPVTNAEQRASEGRSTTGDLAKQLSEQGSTLVRDELKLAQLEMTRKGKQAGFGLGMLGASALTAVFGAACLIACAIIAISGVLAAWLAALIVGGALLAAAALAALLGKGRIQKATPPVPGQAVGDIKADIQEIKERARR
jgi:VIT1/CCC1 family predicted Fe2+/Mn2+ transporter